MPNLNYEKRHSVTCQLTAAVSAWRLVNFAGTHAGANDDVQGISEQAGAAGVAISLVTGYSYPVEAAGAIAVGAWVGPAADGTGRIASGGSYGRALTAATAAGDLVVVVAGSGSGAGLPPAVRSVASADRISTWANRAALVAAGITTAFFFDVGIGGSWWEYTGSRWRAQRGEVLLKNLTSSVTQTSATRAVMDFCALLPQLWQDGDELVNDSYAVIVSGADTFTHEYGIGTGSGTYGTAIGYTDASLTNGAAGLRRTLEWRRVSGTVIRPVSANTPSGIGSATAANTDITAGFDLDSATTYYMQLAGKLASGAGAVSSLRKSRWLLRMGA